MTQFAYEQLCKENIEWLEQFPDTLERKHIIAIIQDSIRHYYPPDFVHLVQESVCPNEHKIGLYDANCDYECIGK